MYNQEALSNSNISTISTLEQKSNNINNTPIDEQACAIDPASKTEQYPVPTASVQELNTIRDQLTLVKTTIGDAPKEIPLTILRPNPATFGFTIEKDAVTLGEPLGIEELETLSKDSGIIEYVNSSYESRTISKIATKLHNEEIHFTVSRCNNNTNSNNLYLSTLNLQLSLPLSSPNDELAKHASVFKSMLIGVKDPIVNHCYYYTDIVTCLLVIDGEYSISDVDKMKGQLKRAFAQSTNNTIYNVMYLNMCGYPQLQTIGYKYKEPHSCIEQIDNTVLTYIIMTMTLNIQDQKRKSLLEAKYIRQLSLQIGSEIATSTEAKEIVPVTFSLIKDTVNQDLNRYTDYLKFKTIDIHYYYNYHNKRPYIMSAMIYHKDTTYNRNIYWLRPQLTIRAYSEPKSLNARTALKEALTQPEEINREDNQLTISECIQ